MSELEREYEKAVDKMLEEIETLKKVTGNYNPTYFKNMRINIGALRATKILVVKPNQTSGFKRLCTSGLSRITLEALVLRPEFKELFTQEEIEAARFNLRTAGGLE